MTGCQTARRGAARIIPNEGRLLRFDDDDPVGHLSSLEAVWRILDAGTGPDTLVLRRLKPCVLIGASQQAGQTVNVGYCQRVRIPIIRRPSEGGAIYLDGECLVFSLVLKKASFEPYAVNGLFPRFQNAVADAIRSYGIMVTTKPPNDVLVDGRKIAGLTATEWYSIVSLSGTLLAGFDALAVDAAFTSPVSNRLTSLSRELGRSVSCEDVADTLIAGLRVAFGINFTAGELTEAELLEASNLRSVKYGSPAWNNIGS